MTVALEILQVEIAAITTNKAAQKSLSDSQMAMKRQAMDEQIKMATSTRPRRQIIDNIVSNNDESAGVDHNDDTPSRPSVDTPHKILRRKRRKLTLPYEARMQLQQKLDTPSRAADPSGASTCSQNRFGTGCIESREAEKVVTKSSSKRSTTRSNTENLMVCRHVPHAISRY